MAAASALTIDKAPFGTVDGKAVDLYTLKNAHGIEMKVTNYGGIVTSLVVPDKKGVRATSCSDSIRSPAILPRVTLKAVPISAP